MYHMNWGKVMISPVDFRQPILTNAGYTYSHLNIYTDMYSYTHWYTRTCTQTYTRTDTFMQISAHIKYAKTMCISSWRHLIPCFYMWTSRTMYITYPSIDLCIGVAIARSRNPLGFLTSRMAAWKWGGKAWPNAVLAGFSCFSWQVRHQRPPKVWL